ncbi:MAG: glycosyltransferase family 4 protein [Nitrospira sp.]
MKTAFFTQNIKKGGLDTFIINLIRHWPQTDSIIVFCNRSHPGLSEIRARVPDYVEIVPYDFLIAQDINSRFAQAPSLVRLAVRGLFGLAGVPYLVFMIGKLYRQFCPDRLMVVNGSYPGGDACVAATIAWARFQPKQLAWHNIHNLAIPYHCSMFRKVRDQLMDLFMARSAAGFVGVSSACIESLAIRSGLQSCRKTYIYNGIEPLDPIGTSSLAHELSLPAGAQIILMLAVYEARKGHDFIIRVMQDVVASIPDAYLLICGDGTDEEVQVVKDLRKASPVGSHILLQGHRPDIGNLMKQVRLLVMPSRNHESFGYTVVEAMACSLPVVVTDVGGLPEVVGDGITGFVVRRHDAKEFATRIVSLLRDEALREQMGRMGFKRFKENFLADRMAKEYVCLIENKAASLCGVGTS